MALLQNLSLWSKAIGLVGLVGLGGGAWAYARHTGYVDGRAAAEAECATEKATQRAANAAAIEASRRQLFRLADDLSQKTLEIDNAVAAALAAAAADPSGGQQCLGLGSVRRLAPIR